MKRALKKEEGMVASSEYVDLPDFVLDMGGRSEEVGEVGQSC
jgi:hypothetical protein